MKTYADREKKMQSRTFDKPCRKTIVTGDLFTQFRKSKSRGIRGRTYILPETVKNHIFTNSFNGSGFHATVNEPNKIKYVVPFPETPNRQGKVYKANHLDRDERSIVAFGKTMFPDSLERNSVISIIQRALTNPDLTSDREKQRINQEGTTEESNRTLPTPVIISGKRFIHGKADGIRIEALVDGANIANAYPLLT